ncbi:MAG TPA: hypothetical protein VK788_24635 [Terriglobales bacterium]|jgi:hypothetical protein|nr:hypothetical protein [Terriglobales bacterium]
MKRPSRPRTPVQFSDSTRHQLNMYAVAAGAAGVGMLALAQPSEAKIVYTPANVQIVGKMNLDLNHDGIPDFEFCAFGDSVSSSYCSKQGGSRTLARKHLPSPFFDDLSIFPANSHNEIWGHLTFRQSPAAAALPAGVRIGSKGKFSPGHRLMATWGSASGQTYYGGPWKNAQHRYLGLKFIIKGKVHYGWARLDIHWHPKISATLTGYAYETIPGKSIITGKTKGPDDQSRLQQPSPTALAAPPKPATLGLLALGAGGLSVWRRESVGSLGAGPCFHHT